MRRNPEPPKRGGVEDTRNYGDEATCAVCHTGLGRPPHPEGIDLCEEHTEEDYERAMDVMDERKRERMDQWAKKLEEEAAEQQDYIGER